MTGTGPGGRATDHRRGVARELVLFLGSRLQRGFWPPRKKPLGPPWVIHFPGNSHIFDRLGY